MQGDVNTRPSVLGQAAAPAASDEELGLRSGVRASRSTPGAREGSDEGDQEETQGASLGNGKVSRAYRRCMLRLLVCTLPVGIICFFVGLRVGQGQGAQPAGPQQSTKVLVSKARGPPPPDSGTSALAPAAPALAAVAPAAAPPAVSPEAARAVNFPASAPPDARSRADAAPRGREPPPRDAQFRPPAGPWPTRTVHRPGGPRYPGFYGQTRAEGGQQFPPVTRPTLPEPRQRAPAADGGTGPSGLEWEKTTRLGVDGHSQCDYRRAMYDQRVTLCIRPYNDLVSARVRDSGEWGECRELVYLWHSHSLGSLRQASNEVFFDIGANIGLCTVRMAAATNAKQIFAFEPSSANLFYLTGTFLKNPSLLSRLHLFPVGLGVADADLPIYAEPGNAGHSVVGAPVGEEQRAFPVRAGTVKVRRLDDLIKPPYPNIRLAKIDVEGFETKVLRGGRNLFSSGAVRSVFFELSPFLRGQGSSKVELVNLFLEFGFEFKESGGQSMSPMRLRSLACAECPHCFANLFAVMAHHSPVTAQRPLRCAR